MELRQLVYFDAVVRFGGFTRAAGQLHVAQPAISAQVRRLEDELGAVLLSRSQRRVALTHAGELFWRRVQHVLEQLDHARADLDDLSNVLRGRVRIGTTQVLGSLDLPNAMASFRRRHPEVTLSLGVGLVSDLLARLDAGEVDVVLAPAHPDLHHRYQAVGLAEESLVLIRPLGSPELPRDATTLSAVHGEPFVCLPRGSGLHAILVAAAESEGFTPRIDFETDGPASIRELVAAGLGVALLAASVATAPGPPVDVCDLQPALRHPPISLINVREAPSAAAPRAFCDYLVAGAGQPRVSQRRE